MFEENLRRRVEHIESLVARGRLTRAQSQTEDLVTDFPRFWRATRLMAQIALERGALDEATPLFERVLAVVPEEAQSHRALSAILEQQGEAERALGHALCVYEQYPDRREARDRLRALYHQMWGQPLGALPPTPAARGHLMLRRGKPGTAVAQFRKALVEAPARLDLYSALTVAAWLAGQKVLARHAARHLYEQLPSALVACLILGHDRQGAGDDSGPGDLLRQASQLDPMHELATRLFGTPPVRPRPAPRAPGRTRPRRKPVARRTEPPDEPPDWILYLLGRTRAELTRARQSEPLPAAVDADWLVQRRAELDRSLNTQRTPPPVMDESLSAAETAWRAGRTDEALALCRQELQDGATDREAVVARLTRWTDAPDAPATLFVLLGDIARQSGDAREAAHYYREAFERG